MSDNSETRVNLTDRMVLTAVGLGLAYWIIETLLYVFLSYRLSFTERLFGPDLGGLSTRIVAICLFLIFGSHAQFTFNKRREAEQQVAQLKEKNECLEKEVQQLKEDIEG